MKRLQDWIRLPSIAAESRAMNEGCELMMQLARDAGFQAVSRVDTDGHPSVFATLDAGATRTVGLYFMSDVKQADPAEWSSPPFAAELVDKPGFGKVVMGRGAVNQKGPEAAFLAALHAIRGAGRKPPVNLVLIAESEEEIGSPHFRQAVLKPEVAQALKGCMGIFMPSAARIPTAESRSRWEPRASWSWSSSRAARSGAGARGRTSTRRTARVSTARPSTWCRRSTRW